MGWITIVGAIVKLIAIGVEKFFSNDKEKQKKLAEVKRKGDEAVKKHNWGSLIDAVNERNSI